MDYREESFRRKFADAARELGVSPTDLVSLKVRDTVGSYGDYHGLLQVLDHDLTLPLAGVQGSFQGRAHLLGDRQTGVIVVEHETGLEILYIAGSVASLLGLIPTILRAWRAIRGGIPRRHHPDVDRIEVRRLDDQGHLQEEHLRDALAAPLLGLGGTEPALASLGYRIEAQLVELADKVRSLATRVDNLEKQLAAATNKGRKSRVTKTTTPAH